MKGMAAATVPAVSAMPPAAASGCPGRTIPSAATGTVTVHLSKLGPVPDDAEGRTLYLPEAAKSTTPTGGGACAFAWPPPLTDTNGQEAGESGATAVRRQRIRRQGPTRLIGDR